jgi:hypothetical protein
VSVIHLRVCRRCGGPARQRKLCVGESCVAQFDACNVCVDEVCGRLDRVRPVFQAMLDVRVPHDVANEVMALLLRLLDQE